MGRKRKNLKEKEDRISALPDAIIHHILSFLPSTKQAIQTSLLSKRWQKQWTHVPVLIFDFSGTLSGEDISRTFRSIDNTLILHDCSKIKKFQFISFQYNFTLDPNYIEKLRFPIRKEAEELSLTFIFSERNKLPNFFFNNVSLIKLVLHNCTLIPDGSVNWERLKRLYIVDCCWPNQAIEGVLSGSPLLESLEINYCQGFDRLAIASKSLKRLVLVDLTEWFDLDVSCPNLVEFYAMINDLADRFILSDGAIKSVVSGSPLLELLELNNCDDTSRHLVINSNSLKKLVLVETFVNDAVISCPNLEKLHVYSLDFRTIKLMNMPSSVCVSIDFYFESVIFWDMNSERWIPEQLHNVKELNIGPYFIKILSALEMSGVSCPSINSKCLTLDGGPNFVENLPGIAYALRSSPELEKLVIILRRHFECATPHDFPDLNVSKENYWNSKGTVFNCLVSHLKIVKIFGFSENDDQLNLALNFVEFLLKNARVLEKMVIILEDRGADFVFKVSQKLLSFSRFSRHAMVKSFSSLNSSVKENIMWFFF